MPPAQPTAVAALPDSLQILASHLCFKEDESGIAFEELSVISDRADRDAGIPRPVELRRAQPKCIPLSALFLAV